MAKKISDHNRRLTIAYVSWFFIFAIPLSAAAYGVYSIINHSLSEIDKKSVKLVYDGQTQDGLPYLTRTYGLELDVSDIKITYQHNSHDKWYFVTPTLSMVKKYDSELMGLQKPAIIFNDQTLRFYVFSEPQDIKKPTIAFNYASRTISWNKVVGASSYQIYCGSSEGSMESVDFTINNSYDLSNIEQSGEIYVAIKALKQDEHYADSPLSNICHLFKLEAPNNLTYSDAQTTHRISWDEVVDADYYSLEIDGNVQEHITDNYFVYDAPAGSHLVTVRAYSNLNDYIFSDTSYSFSVLDEVKNISINNRSLNWDKVLDATSYDVYLGGSDNPINTLTNSLSLEEIDAGYYSINIIANSISSSIYSSHDSTTKGLINFEIKLASNVLSWPNLGEDFTYLVMIDNAVVTSALSTSSLDLRTLNINGGDHEVKVRAVHSKDVISNDISNIIEFRKLNKPELSIYGNHVISSGEKTPVSLYLDDVLFDGNLEGVSPDSHVIKGQYFAQTDLQVDSDIGYLNVVKLSAPVISVSDSKISYDYPSRSIEFYLNGVVFDGNLNNINPGTYTITARYISDIESVLNSDLSNGLSITKYSAPVLKYSNHEILVIKNDDNVTFYDGGNEFSGDFNDLSRGMHVITAQNIGDGSSTLSSSISDPIEVYRSDAELRFTVIDQNKGTLSVVSSDTIVSIAVTANFYLNPDDVMPFDTLTYDEQDTPSTLIRFNRGAKGVASRVDFSVKITISYNETIILDTITATFIVGN